jgi:hypothetical protein
VYVTSSENESSKSFAEGALRTMHLAYVRSIGLLIVSVALVLPANVHADPYLEQEADQAEQAPDAGENPPDDGNAPSGGASASAQQAGPVDQAWPRQINGDGYSIYLYAPQVEGWDQKKLEARAAVAVQTQDSAEPTYGVIWLSARTQVDKQKGVVTLKDLQVTKASFPAASDGGPDYLALMRSSVPTGARTIGLARLQANLAAAHAVEKSRKSTLKNDPPRIIYSTTKAMLVLIDGKPVLRPVPGTHLSRVINTRALIVNDQSTSKFYLYVVNQWLEATSIDGPWSGAQDAPDGLDAAKQAAVASKQVNLLDQAGSNARMAVDFGAFPTVYTSTVPAELIQAPGPQMLAPIEGTQLQQVQNTTDNIFQYTPTQDYYVLLSGRWFRAKSTDGPWAFVPANALPADFAQIPEPNLASLVLASVAGTPWAKQALIDNTIPQTATVSRSQATFAPAFDGEPQFKPIAGTALRYAANSATPIIEDQGDPYYAVHNGVWFRASSPRGRWDVATSVPREIYTIPPSSPLYYTTFVNIYGASGDEVYVGYTPGYMGAFASPEGVVVYGTGWAYEPWVGSYWIGPPGTYGLGTDLTWDPLVGYGFGFADDVYFGPWWGPLGQRWADGLDWRLHNFGATDVYGRWGARARAAESARVTDSALGGWRADLYAGRDGLVYRRGERGWEGNRGGDWHRGGAAGAGLESDWLGRRMASDEMRAYRAHSVGAMGFGGVRRR